jgi:oligoendopeptidase F
LYVSHFFETPFYVYAYNFGELLALALYEDYKKEGKKMLPTIEKILQSGGSQDPIVVLKATGYDIASHKFWEKGFDVLRGWQEQLISL